MWTQLTLASALILSGSSYAATHQSAIQVRTVSVHLFLSPSGEFSEDVTTIPSFSSWNFKPTVPLRGLEGERFEAFLIKVRLSSTREAFYKGVLGSVSVVSRHTKKTLYKSPIRDLYVGAGGETVIARFVDGHVCEPVTVVISVGSSRTTKDIEFLCGE